MTTASDGHEALRIVEASPSEFDLLVTDIALPQMRGTDLASRLREYHPKMRILFMSGYSEDKLPVVGSHFIPKPFKRDGLVRKIREVLDAEV